MRGLMHRSLRPLLGLAALPFWFFAIAANPAVTANSCDVASLPTISPVVPLHAQYPKDKIPFPQGSCIVKSALTPVGAQQDIYVEALVPRQPASALVAHFTGVLANAGFKQIADAMQDTSGSGPRVLLRYAAADATVRSRQVLKGTGVRVVVREDSGFPAWSAVGVTLTMR